MLPPDLDGATWEDHGALLRRYSKALLEAAKGARLVVFVDDAHHLDNGSATLFHQLALTQAATVLATVRSDEMVPDAVVDLWKNGPAERVEVNVLEDAVIEDLVAKVLGGPVDAATMRQLSGRSRGNPMFLRELVTGALESGTLVDQGGIWHLRGALRPTARVVELAAQRLGDLTGPERTVLELLTLGEPLGQATLSKLTDAASVETLERKGLISSRLEGRRIQVWLGHPLYGDVVRVGISALRRSALSRARAEVIEAVGGRRREDTLLLASWRLVGGGGSAELLSAGAAAAKSRHDYSLTEHLARAAINEGGGFEARLLAAEAAHFLGRFDQAEQDLAALAPQASSDAQRARVAIVRVENAYLLHGRTDLQLIDDVADEITDPLWIAELSSRRFFVANLANAPKQAAEAARRLPRPSGSGSLSVAHVAAALSLLRVGHLNEAIELIQPAGSARGMPAPDASWDQWVLFECLGAGLVYSGRLKEAEELLFRGYDLVADQPATEARACVANVLALLHLEQGRPVSALRRASESQTLHMQLGRHHIANWPYILLALSFALTGQVDQANGALAAHAALDLPTILSSETDLMRARAWTAAAAGDLPSARHQLEAAADLGEEIGDLLGVTCVLHSLARLGHARQVADRLAETAKKVDGGLVAARAVYASALAARDSSALETVSRTFEDMGAMLYAAEASTEAAVILRRGGAARKAAAAEQKGARLLALCEGAVTPGVRALSARVQLTAGELDTALQAAAGRSNKEIASQMYLSVRTVESHLQRAYEKLGISGRHELAEALRDQLPPA
jgi:DNA-binding CsgD family transcriptional regulator